jgi:hypothetical protein
MSNKTISINPSLLSFSGGLKTRRRDRKAKPTVVPLISPNVLKNKLLHRIKEHKKKETTGLDNKKNSSNINTTINTSINTNIEFSDEFNDSIEYLQTLSKQQKIDREKENFERQRQQKREELQRMTIKNYQALNSSNCPYVNLDLPEELQQPVIHVNTSQEPMNLRYNVDSNVPYGVLKGGVKPTYRDWTRKQRDMEVTNGDSSLIIQSGGISTERENRLRNLRERIKMKSVMESMQRDNNKNDESFTIASQNLIQKPLIQQQPFIQQPLIQQPLNQQQPLIQQPFNQQPFNQEPRRQLIKKTIKRKYTLGKSKLKNKIAILLKDRGTRKQVITAQRDLKRKPMNDIKTYLRDHNLIKIGSNAPNDVLRKLYESCMLSGEITNKNTDILLHNLNNNDKDL